MAQKITHWLLITLILSLGFGQLLRFDFYGLPVFLHDILILLILIIQISKITVSGNIRKLAIPLGLKIFFVGLLLGFLRATTLYPLMSLLVPSLYALRLLTYLILYLVIKFQKIKIPYFVFIYAGLITILIGLAQYFFLPDMRVFKYLGWDDHLYRLTLPHFDPTFTGVMIGLFGLTILGLSTIYKIPVLFFSSIGILLTYARSIWLVLLLTAFIFIKNKKLLLIFLVALVISVAVLPQKFGEGNNLLRTFSISSRFDTDLAYIKKYKWDLVSGRGMNTTLLDSTPSIYGNHATGPNNSYLYLLTTTGILGLIGWGIFMYSLYKYSHNKSVIIFFAIASLFNNIMFYPFALLWVLLVESYTQKTT